MVENGNSQMMELYQNKNLVPISLSHIIVHLELIYWEIEKV